MDSTLLFSPLYQIDEYSDPRRCSGRVINCTLCLSTVLGVTIDYAFREYDWNWVRRLLGLQIVGDGGDKIVDSTIRSKHFSRVSFINNDYDVSVEKV